MLTPAYDPPYFLLTLPLIIFLVSTAKKKYRIAVQISEVLQTICSIFTHWLCTVCNASLFGMHLKNPPVFLMGSINSESQLWLYTVPKD